MVQGQTDIPYQSRLQPWGSYIAQVAFVFLCLINGFDVFFPGRFSASSFLTAYVGIPIFLVIYLAHRVYRRKDPWAFKSEDVDLYTDLDGVIAAEKPRPAQRSIWLRIKENFT